MAVRSTIELGNPALRQPAQPVVNASDPAIQALITDLHDTLHDWRAHHGWGRAMSAPTIGVAQRVVVIDWDDIHYVFINPRFEQWSTQQSDEWESCITFPNLWGCVSRPHSVVVTAWDADGQPLRLQAEGALSRILQHEIDHLDGLIWLDREPDPATLCTTAEYNRRYKPQP